MQVWGWTQTCGSDSRFILYGCVFPSLDESGDHNLVSDLKNRGGKMRLNVPQTIELNDQTFTCGTETEKAGQKQQRMMNE